MLHYRHSYHAGNFADVIKHVALVALLQNITRKPEPCYVYDSHAGCGIYDLDSAEALRTKEFGDGIGRIWSRQDAPPVIERYLDLVRERNPGLLSPRYYPGSPAIAQALLRRQDRLLLTDLHPRDHADLVRQFRQDKRIQIYNRDAYQGLRTFLPPAETHGLVLIDPPYEHEDEYRQVLSGLKAGHARWQQGLFAIWYPIMSQDLQTRFLEGCAGTGVRKQLHAEFQIAPFTANRQFLGCGLILVNPPEQLVVTLETCLHWLRVPLQQVCEPSIRVSWLVGE